jgi:hypothetical protein
VNSRRDFWIRSPRHVSNACFAEPDRPRRLGKRYDGLPSPLCRSRQIRSTA